MMRTLTVAIDDFEFARLGLTSDHVSFAELKKALWKAHAQEALRQCHQIANSTGLSNMTLDDINAEIQAVRYHA